MANQKAKYTKVGVVMKGDKNNYVILGNSKSKKEKYRYNVTLTVTDNEGNELASMTNGVLNAFNPRSRASEEQLERIPESLLAELFIIQ